MNAFENPDLVRLLGGMVALLAIGTIAGQVLRRTARSESGQATVRNINDRMRAWWIMAAVFTVAIITGGIGSIVLFGLVSFLALREFVTLVASSRADHRTLVIAFFVFTPLQYVLVAVEWYGLFAILIPVYVFVLVPTTMVIVGETERFLERAATIQWGLMACVYCVSYAPALLLLDVEWDSPNALLLFFLVVVVQLSDVAQYVWGKTLGRHKIAPRVSPNKTWEGFVGGVLTATAVGAGLWWATPFDPLEAAGMAFVICLAGFAGGLTMAAIKRDRGVKDYGTLLPGHGGVLDRIDSLTFAAPLFFHLTRFFF
ncbi:MAG TPA: phosphatidate cytidylyltransferase [Solirubrobacteraceae bacterium]|nr:phosphatidate cytidylyltransferase [Solirubrobacteraceae bacterium]